jgi:hypothetical protein
MKKVNLVQILIKAESENKINVEKGKARHPRMPYLHQTGRFIQLLGETNEQYALPSFLLTSQGDGISYRVTGMGGLLFHTHRRKEEI